MPKSRRDLVAHLNMELTAPMHLTMLRLRKQFDAASNAEVIRRCLYLADTLVKASEGKGKFIYVDENGHETQMKLF